MFTARSLHRETWSVPDTGKSQTLPACLARENGCGHGAQCKVRVLGSVTIVLIYGAICEAATMFLSHRHALTSLRPQRNRRAVLRVLSYDARRKWLSI